MQNEPFVGLTIRPDNADLLVPAKHPICVTLRQLVLTTNASNEYSTRYATANSKIKRVYERLNSVAARCSDTTDESF